METTHPTIEASLRAFILEQCLSRNGRVELNHETDLFEEGVVDSAGLLSVVAFIEDEYGLAIPDEDLLPENFVTVARMAEYVRAHLPGQDA